MATDRTDGVLSKLCSVAGKGKRKRLFHRLKPAIGRPSCFVAKTTGSPHWRPVGQQEAVYPGVLEVLVRYGLVTEEQHNDLYVIYADRKERQR